VILFHPNDFAAEIYGDEGGKSFIKGDDVPILQNRDRFPIPPQGGFSLSNFIDGEMGLKIHIQKSPASTLPDLFFHRELSITT
jgi:hypothetical protein